MHSQEIGLGQRVLDFKDFRKVVDCLVGTLKCKASLVLETSGSVDANRDALASVLALGHGFDIFEVTHCPGQELYEESILRQSRFNWRGWFILT